MYATLLSSPGVPGWRPIRESAASTRMCCMTLAVSIAAMASAGTGSAEVLVEAGESLFDWQPMVAQANASANVFRRDILSGEVDVRDAMTHEPDGSIEKTTATPFYRRGRRGRGGRRNSVVLWVLRDLCGKNAVCASVIID